MPDPVVPGPPASVLAAVSGSDGSALPPSNPAFTGRATFAAQPGLGIVPGSLMTEIVQMPSSAYLDADVTIGGNLTVDGTFTGDVFALVTPTAVQTGAYNANPGDFVVCDTTSTAFTVTLPVAPDNGTVIGAEIVAQASSHAVTIAASGSDVFNIAAGPATLTLSSVNQGVLLQYSLAAGIWYQIAAVGAAGGSPTGSAGGALAGTYPNPSLAVPVTVTGSSSAALVSVTNNLSAPGSPPVQVKTATAGDRAIGALVAGDGNLRFRVGSDGKIQWGPGSATQDVDLYRSGAGTVTTDNTLTAGTIIATSPIAVASGGTGASTVLGAATALGFLTNVASTGTAGVSLINGTQSILTWAVPNDGALHRVLCLATLMDTGSQTGGAVTLQGTVPNGSAFSPNVFSGGLSAGGHQAQTTSQLQPGTNVILQQSSALTGGTSVIFADLYAD